MKKMLAVVMVVVMLVCGTSTIYAAVPEDTVMPCDNMLTDNQVTLTISSSGLATVKVVASGNSSTDRLQAISYLEKKVGSSWERVDLDIANDWWHDIVEGTYLSETHQFQLSSRGTY